MAESLPETEEVLQWAETCMPLLNVLIYHFEFVQPGSWDNINSLQQWKMNSFYLSSLGQVEHSAVHAPNRTELCEPACEQGCWGEQTLEGEQKRLICYILSGLSGQPHLPLSLREEVVGVVVQTWSPHKTTSAMGQ